LSTEPPFKIYGETGFQSSSLVVGWSEDAGKLGSKVVDYLNKKLGCQEFARIEPVDFFPLGGVSIEDDIAQFPESKFYYCPERNLVTFKSNPPRAEWYKFLNSVLDVAQHYCHVKELYATVGMISPIAHTTPRELLAVANSSEMKKVLAGYNLNTNMDYQTPPGYRPTLSPFLLWVAEKRKVPGAVLSVPIPFYLASVEDPQSWRNALELYDQRFGLGIDFTDLDEDISGQKEKMAQARIRFPEIDDYIGKLESNLSLTEEESQRLVTEMEEFLTGTE
jgi:proteasome assembly chaperone (PAC2) family protein